MDAIRILFIIALIAIWGTVGWIVMHLRGVKRELKADEALPEGTPRTNILIYLAVFLVAVSALLLYLIL